MALRDPADGPWHGAVDVSWPDPLRVGRGSAMPLVGWLFNERSPLRSLTACLDDRAVALAIHSVPRLDVAGTFVSDDRLRRRAYRSGYWGILPIEGVDHPTASHLHLTAEARNGERYDGGPWSLSRAPERARTSAGDPRQVTICMATYEPDLGLLRRQLDSLRAQTYPWWRCVISDDGSSREAVVRIRHEIVDDERFELRLNADRRGAYFNFERVLRAIPSTAGYVALADQDDHWYPRKIEVLVSELERTGAALAYSDQRLVRPNGDVLSETFWSERANQCDNLEILALSNTVTGAASLFRASLLDDVLPFPPALPGDHHDHWIALVARTVGSITYVDDVLYDYVQHDGQLVGHALSATPTTTTTVGTPDPWARRVLLRTQRQYFERLFPVQLKATALLTRFGPRLHAAERRRLELLAAGDTSADGLRHLGVLAHHRRTGPTNGYARDALAGAAWRRAVTARARFGAPVADSRHSLVGESLTTTFPPPDDNDNDTDDEVQAG
jgi:hypothetical protein